MTSKHKDPESPHQKLGKEVYANNLSLTEEQKQIDSWSSVDIYPSTVAEFQFQWATLPQNIKEESHVRQKRYKISTPSQTRVCIQLLSFIHTVYTQIKKLWLTGKKTIRFKTALELTIILGERSSVHTKKSFLFYWIYGINVR